MEMIFDSRIQWALVQQRKNNKSRNSELSNPESCFMKQTLNNVSIPWRSLEDFVDKNVFVEFSLVGKRRQILLS